MTDSVNNSIVLGSGSAVGNINNLAVGAGAAAGAAPVPRQAEPAPERTGDPPVAEGERYLTALAVDIEGFNGRDRDDPIRVRLHDMLRDLLLGVLASVGIEAAHCPAITSTGDGWLILADETVSRASLVQVAAGPLRSALREHNRIIADHARLRVRVVVHAGEMLLTRNGAVGEQLNLAFRLLDSDTLRDLLRATAAPMVLCVSDHIYQQVIRQRHHGCDPAEFSAIGVSVKETSTRAWVHNP